MQSRSAHALRLDDGRGPEHPVGVNSSGRTDFILLRSIYEGHEIDVDRLAFIEGHGTGTRISDPAEAT